MNSLELDNCLIAFAVNNHADRLSDEFKFAAWRNYNAARGVDIDAWLESGGKDGEVEGLPDPVEGSSFTVENAKAYAITAGELQDA